MIQVDGFMAFRGTMRITSTNPEFPQREIFAGWLYKPEHDCWYNNYGSYPAAICQILEDETA